jgi:hypothetical protein
MNYDLSKLNAEPNNNGNTSPYIGYGSRQVLRITQIELKHSQNTGSPKAIFHMETPTVKTEGFTPIDGATGRVGKVACGVYMKDDYAKKEFLRRLLNIAIAIGVEDEVSAIRSDSFEQAVKEIETILTTKNGYAKYTIFGQEYPKTNGKIGITLFLPRNNFVEKIDANPSILVEFDKNNPYHYKKLPLEEKEEFRDGGGTVGNDDSDVSDLPF